MKIVIAGAAEVGTHLARLLSRENMDVTLMDQDPHLVEQLTFFNLLTVVGSPTSISALKEAEVPSADLFIAVTPNESVNIHACILAANLGVRRTLARIDNYEMQKPESREFYKKIGINRLVYPEMLGGEAVAQAISRPWARMSFDLCDGKFILLTVKVYDGAPIVGQKLMDIGRNHPQYHIAAIKRGDEVIIPGGNDMILSNDIVYFVCPPDKTESVRMICGKKDRNLKRVVIMGGSRLAIQAAYNLQKNYEIMFIEQDLASAENIMEKVPSAKVVHGDQSDMEFLSSVGLLSTDAFVALGGNSGNNVLACLTAKKLGVGKTVAEVEDIEYISLAANLNIGSTINKKILTASSIYQLLLDADKTSAKCFSLVDAEVADLVAQPGSKITKCQVMQLGLPRGITLGGLVRDGKAETVTGQTVIQPGDHVVVVCMNEKINQVEKLFLR
ncbi:MAG: Trk system potassium transporter TrkA [Bacteroidales bacterium]|nr:Trk system potassium transporter TrkA [Candidatus Liminaster caballi]